MYDPVSDARIRHLWPVEVVHDIERVGVALLLNVEPEEKKCEEEKEQRRRWREAGWSGVCQSIDVHERVRVMATLNTCSYK